MTVDEILSLLGGRRAVEQTLRVSRSAPYNWRFDGIPSRHWHVLVELAAKRRVKGISFEALRTAKRAVRSGREQRVKTDSKPVRKTNTSAVRKIETQAA